MCPYKPPECEPGQMYFYGKPCDHGHDGKRFCKSGACVECRRARNRGENTGMVDMCGNTRYPQPTYLLRADWTVELRDDQTLR